MKRSLPFMIAIAGLVILDQVTKVILARSVPHGTSLKVIPGFFDLSHIHNRGAIFGFFNHSGSSFVFILLTAASLTALGLVVYYFARVPASETWLKLALSLVMAGALGNQLDRLTRGYVIDFLDFYIGKRHFPSFNVADSCITIGAGLLIYIFFFKKGPKCSLCSSKN